MKIFKLVMSEMLIAFLVGGVPFLILSIYYPELNVVGQLSSLRVKDPVVVYMLYLLVIYLAFWGVDRYILKTNQTISFLSREVHKFSYKVGFTIHGIYRIFAGAVPAAICLLVYERGFGREALIVSAASSLFVMGALFVCCVLAWVSEKTAPKPKWF